ncbi:MAG: alpha/beta hydrolase [Nitratireductor sp.]
MNLRADMPVEDETTAVLHEIPGNRVPDRARAGFFDSRDGKRLRYALFPAQVRPLKGTVIILTGRNECIEKYFETIGDLSKLGLGSAVMDWRGQGGSERLTRDPQRGHVDSFDDYVADLDRFFTDIALPDCRGPFYILAHSTGALVALLAAPSLTNRVRRMVLSAPLLAFEGRNASVAGLRRISSLFYALGLGTIYLGWGRRPAVPPPFATNKLTTDFARYQRNIALYERFPQLALGGPTAGWVRAACRAIEKVTDPAFAARIQVPTLFVAAGADMVVSTRAIERYATGLRAASLLTIDGARHELLQEADIYREQLLAAFAAFVPGTDTAIA